MNLGDILPMIQSLKTNPLGVLLQKNYNIPQDISNDPNKIIQHLLSTGQVSQEQVNLAYQQGRLLKR